MRLSGWLCLAWVVGTGVAAASPPASPPSGEQLRAAAARALVPLVETSAAWPDKRTCTSCHHQSLPAAAFTAALRHGVPFDTARAADAMRRGFNSLTDLDRAVQATRQVDPSGDWGTQLTAAETLGVPGNGATTALARLILGRQRSDGSWNTIDNRPPQSASLVVATAYAAHAVDVYAGAGNDEWKRRADRAVARAAAWLASVTPRDTTDAIGRLQGLAWMRADAAAVQSAAAAVRSAQRADGGWAQLPSLESDAFTTASAVVALRAAGTGTNDASVVRGLRRLLDTQLPDGTWHVRTRIVEQDLVSPPHFESGFPHGPDQMISAMATAVAVTALAGALPALTPQPEPLVDPRAWRIADEPAWVRIVQSGTIDDLRRALDGGLSPDAATPEGTSLLMVAAPDPARLQLLLDRGADPNRAASDGVTPLVVAANHTGGTAAVRALLARGARVAPPPRVVNDMTAVAAAVWSGDVDTLEALLAHGGVVPAHISIAGGQSYLSALDIALVQRDEPMVRALVAHGADVRGIDEGGLGLPSQAALMNDARMLRLVVSLGADPNQVDEGGETPLMHAAQIDYGETEVLTALLEAGASRETRNRDGKTALDLARTLGLTPIVAILEAPAPSLAKTSARR